mmetsp:Transcript_9306/g.27230  ORF Transcript_9306/g.27230 Transcript_9306/m.27230 type:complete len:208 (-) Transcript_9306:500-1123(-)
MRRRCHAGGDRRPRKEHPRRGARPRRSRAVGLSRRHLLAPLWAGAKRARRAARAGGHDRRRHLRAPRAAGRGHRCHCALARYPALLAHSRRRVDSGAGEAVHAAACRPAADYAGARSGHAGGRQDAGDWRAGVEAGAALARSVHADRRRPLDRCGRERARAAERRVAGGARAVGRRLPRPEHGLLPRGVAAGAGTEHVRRRRGRRRL